MKAGATQAIILLLMAIPFKRAISLAAASVIAFGLDSRGALNAAPGASETRTYQVSIDDKPSGLYQLKLATHGADVDVDSSADVDYRFLFVHEVYRYRGHEKWQGPRLVAINSECTDCGRKCVLSMQSAGDGADLHVNGKSRRLNADTLASSYWWLPKSGDFASQFIEVDTGRVFNARFKYVGNEMLAFNDRQEPCKHYKVSGEDKAEVWYDHEDRMVQELTDGDGHPTFIKLQHIDYR